MSNRSRDCHDVGMLAALPPGQPGKGQLHEVFDVPRLAVELDVLLDCDSISETTSCVEALVVLLRNPGHPHMAVFRRWAACRCPS